MTLLLLGYDVREGVDRGEYEQWLRDVDCPFWNARPGVARYENWKVAEEKVGKLGFPYFDLIWLEDGASFESVFGQPEVQEFAAGWVQRWGLEPEATDPSRNFKLGTAEVVAAPGDVALPGGLR
jgi:hypothetical protein